MEINGNNLADQIRSAIKVEAERLVENGIRPHLAIITVGDDETWSSYVNQKLKWAKRLSMRATVIPVKPDTQVILSEIQKLNSDPTIHGIIVQRPLPEGIDTDEITNHILPIKDVDGFRADSPYEVPVWLAVHHILTVISQDYENNLEDFLRGKTVTVIGKGETAGKPVTNGLKHLNINPIVIDRSTHNPDQIIRESDIVISCVGKDMVQKNQMHKGQILIGVGIRKEQGKVLGDYSNSDAQEQETIYTPTPSGVGPINLAFLLQNLVQAAQFQKRGK